MNRLPEAVDAFRGALAHSPAFAHAHWNLALALLAQGDYSEGFREYEWRLHLGELGGRAPRLPVARWHGEDLRDRTLLLTAEQGIGDALQFVRFASHAADRGGRVIVQAGEELRPLLATAAGVAATIGSDDDVSKFDFELPLLSLPHVLGVADPTSGAVRRYLQSDPKRRAGIASRIASPDASSMRIGVAWAGAAHHRNDRRRSLPLAALTSLFALPGTRWHSLQKGPAASQLARVGEAADVIPLDPDADFTHTAALVDLLDAVVTVDTSIAHLAGALGKPTFVLLPFAADWRWGVAGERSAWYPSARLFRQPSPGDWGGAIASLRAALAAR
jgi:hypothetical protein